MPPLGQEQKKRKHLVDVEVTHVSLVDRPANRTPFKAIKRDDANDTKGEKPMEISLKNMFGARPAEVTSVMADTEAKARAVAKAIMDCDKADLTVEDGVFVVRKTGSNSADERVIHLGKKAGIAYGVSNLSKELSLYDATSTDFDETMKAEGFVPGLHVGMEVLHQTIFNIAMSEEASSPQAFGQSVQKAIDEFGAYVSDLISALPERAFKFEKALVVISPNDISGHRPIPDGFSSEVYDAMFSDADKEAEEGTKEATAGTEGEDAPKDAEAAGEATTAAEDTAKDAVADAAPKNLQELPKGTPETEVRAPEDILSEALETLTKNMGETIAKALEPVTQRLDASEANLTRLSKAVAGSVTATPEDDPDNVVILAKSGAPASQGGEPPLMDTAYRSNRNRG